MLILLDITDESQPMFDLCPNSAPQNHLSINLFKNGGLKKTIPNIKFFIVEFVVELLSNVVYGALGSVPHFLNTIDKFYSLNYFT